jgi:hypothetical protein
MAHIGQLTPSPFGALTELLWCRARGSPDGLRRAQPLPALSGAGASLAAPCSVSTPRSSNRTCGFPASGFRSSTHAFAHGKLRGRALI